MALTVVALHRIQKNLHCIHNCDNCDLKHVSETKMYDLLIAAMQFMCLIQFEAQHYRLQT